MRTFGAAERLARLSLYVNEQSVNAWSDNRTASVELAF